MIRKRYCSRRGVDVRCHEEWLAIEGSHSPRLRLRCPSCGRVMADLYGAELEITPVVNAKISRG